MVYAELSNEERERLRLAYEAGFSAGSFRPSLIPDEWIDFTDSVQDDWFEALETMQATHHARYAVPGPEVVIPEWLRAEQERLIALGDAEPPIELLSALGRGAK